MRISPPEFIIVHPHTFIKRLSFALVGPAKFKAGLKDKVTMKLFRAS